MNRVRTFLLCLILFWLLGFMYVFLSSTNGEESTRRKAVKNKQVAVDYYDPETVDDNVKLNFKKLLEDLHNLEVKNQKNEQIIRNLRKVAHSIAPKLSDREALINTDDGPSYRFEDTRRQIFTDIKDLSFFLNNQIMRNDQVFQRDNSEVKHFQKSLQHRIDLIISQMYNLSISDHFGEWRQTAAKNLATKVQKRFHELQNPSDCSAAKKIICNLNKACGYGCQIHHLMYCFTISFFTNRTMILDSNNWRYNSQGFGAYFQSISQTCAKNTNYQTYADWNGVNRAGNLENEQNIKLPIIDSLGLRPEYLPMSIPKEYMDELVRFHGDPFVWWAGQMLTFLTTFNDEFKLVVESKTKKLDFNRSCVGVHVRRTDKVGTEAAYHHLDEYMTEVELFYDLKEMSTKSKNMNVQRCVYLASDEITVLQEAKKKYPNYKFIYDEENSKTASLNERYSPASAQGIILDIHFLSQCDYLVCTFSSQVCRLAYEYMQARFPDGSWRFRSLDDVYYFGGGNGHQVVALYDHIPKSDTEEIEMKAGDIIGLAGNHWNGFSKGKNMRTQKIGLFPSYKVKNVLQVY